jgi:hypothetical protein
MAHLGTTAMLYYGFGLRGAANVCHFDRAHEHVQQNLQFGEGLYVGIYLCQDRRHLAIQDILPTFNSITLATPLLE